jgi:LuxR family maltose regulon positive regulatory protein
MFGLAALIRSEPDDAIQALEKALILGETYSGPDSIAAALPASYLAWIYYERNDMPNAKKMIAGRTAVVMKTCPQGALLRHACTVARLGWREGDNGTAFAIIDRARQVSTVRQCSQLRVGCDAEAVRLYLSDGRLADARSVFEELRATIPVVDQSQTADNLKMLTTYSMMEARLLLADGNSDQAVAVLEGLRSRAGAGNLWYPDAQASILLALAFEQSALYDEALSSIERALVIAQATGLISTFSDEGKAMQQLLLRWKGSAPKAATFETAYLDRLFTAINSADFSASPRCIEMQQDRSYLLSQREIEILDHVSRGLSNKEIARALRVAPETIKWHLKNIFEKLNVSSRVEAMQRGLELTRYPRR